LAILEKLRVSQPKKIPKICRKNLAILEKSPKTPQILTHLKIFPKKKKKTKPNPKK
jgi:hypothetical protein